jgi:hypothetical protein
MDQDYAIKTLKRVYDSAVQAETSEASTVVEHYNEALALLKTEFPENEVIQSKEKNCERRISPDVYQWPC